MSAKSHLAAQLTAAVLSVVILSCLDSFDPAQSRLTLSPSSGTILIGDTLRLHVSLGIRPAPTAPKIDWSSTEPAIATVDSAGLVRGLATGSTVVRAALFDTVVAATLQVTEIVVRPQSAEVLEGDTVRLLVTVVDTRGDTVRQPAVLWWSSDTTVALVDSGGVVQGRGQGVTQVIATNAASSAGSDVHVTAPILVGAGDIGDCASRGDEATSALLDAIPGIVFTLGDNAYPDGSASAFANCYAPSWGRHTARTRPAAGNHDYETPGASPYFAYFGTSAGDSNKGYYSYDYGAWHVVVVNSTADVKAGSPQLQWLAADLATHPALCSIAYFHYPLFSSGAYGIPAMKPVWQILYNAGVDVVASGHDHIYERFAAQDADGRPDPLRGIRQFTVGTGGSNHHHIVSVEPNSEVRNSDTFGVLKLTLHPTGYDWRFVPIAGRSFTDSGSAGCHL